MKYVYMVRAGEDHYKVGVATSIRRRVYELQTSNANQLEVITTKLVEDHYRVERDLHHKLKAMKVGGGREWFRLDPEEALALAAEINDNPEIDVYPNLDMSKQIAEQLRRYKRLEKKVDQLLNMWQRPAPTRTIIPHVEPPAKLDDTKQRAIEAFMDAGYASTSLLQRKLSIGYGRAARLVDQLEADGVVSLPERGGRRQLLLT